MNALTLYVIRHAEKPDKKQPKLGPGFTHKGEEDPESLVIKGWERAGAWTALFGAGFGGADYATPQAVYAADPNGPKDPDPDKKDEVSQRPYETVLSLAKRVGLDKPNVAFAKGQEQALVNALVELSNVDVALVAWEHKAIISGIVADMRPHVSNPQALPTHWNGSRFDVVLRFVREAGGTKFEFTELLPNLMPGDKTTPLKDDPKDPTGT
jgi:hypothetical protein